MDYIGFLVERNKNKDVKELLEWYIETENMNNSNGEIMLARSIKDAISWILRIKSPQFVTEFTRLRRIVK